MLVLAALTTPGTRVVIVTVALLLWPNTARVIRSQVLSLRERAWVEAARVTGCSTARIMFVHVLPQVLPLAALYGSVAIGWAILAEAAASFLGFGDPDSISWGVMLQDAYANQALGRGAWNWFTPPGLAIVLMVLSGFLVSRGSEKLLFPKLAEQGATLLSIRDLHVRYTTSDGTVRAVDGVDLDIPAGSIVGLVGESGCGKSTLARALMGVLPGTGHIAGGSDHFRRPRSHHTDRTRTPRAALAPHVVRAADRDECARSGAAIARADAGGAVRAWRPVAVGRVGTCRATDASGRARSACGCRTIRTSSAVACASAPRSRWHWRWSRRW